MIALILHIIFASTFMLFIKWTQVREREDVITVGLINYIVAAAVILPVFLTTQTMTGSRSAMVTGGSMGAIYFIAFFFVSFSVRTVGASTTTVVSVMSILIPIAFSAWYWEQLPTTLQSFGIGLALLSLTMIGGQTNRNALNKNEHQKWLVPLVLAIFFLLCGCSRLSQEAFKHLCSADQRPTFLLAAFAVSAVPSAIFLVIRRQKILRSEFGLGIGMGIANLLQTFFILKALEFLPGYVVFTLSSAGGIVLTTLVATGLLDERINRRTIVGIVISVVALFLLH